MLNMLQIVVRDLAEWFYYAQVCCLPLLAVVEEALTMHCLQSMHSVVGNTDQRVDVFLLLCQLKLPAVPACLADQFCSSSSA